MNDFVINNRKKIRLFSHILLIISLLNLVYKIYTGQFAEHPYTIIMAFVVQVMCFIIIEMQLGEKK